MFSPEIHGTEAYSMADGTLVFVYHDAGYNYPVVETLDPNTLRVISSTRVERQCRFKRNLDSYMPGLIALGFATGEVGFFSIAERKIVEEIQFTAGKLALDAAPRPWYLPSLHLELDATRNSSQRFPLTQRRWHHFLVTSPDRVPNEEEDEEDIGFHIHMGKTEKTLRTLPPVPQRASITDHSVVSPGHVPYSRTFPHLDPCYALGYHLNLALTARYEICVTDLRSGGVTHPPLLALEPVTGVAMARFATAVRPSPTWTAEQQARADRANRLLLDRKASTFPCFTSVADGAPVLTVTRREIPRAAMVKHIEDGDVVAPAESEVPFMFK
ncbi:hypothetical protein H9P43_005449 [Blastocladiella emersonii ATCC 22665]|nr:hypothetical protein H9P43_005449 [Blastocladiella emersonii ATCC 22665]